MIEIKEKSQCCGCYACVSACPQKCIKMEPDNEGFLYPVVNIETCINCGLCDKVCPIQKESETREENVPLSYALINKDYETRMKSSSGGAFSLLAKLVLEKQGVVFGAALSKDAKKVEHRAVFTLEDLESLLGSKYAQSSIGECYKEAKSLLEQGKMVLFTGTPCQIEGLFRFLGKKYNNLICMDFICHGVPSPKVWQSYLSFQEKETGKTITNVSFRDKTDGWKRFSVFLKFEEGKEYRKDLTEDVYMKAFLQNVSLRPSCYQCHFKKENHMADITVADFWGIDKVEPDLNDDKGISLVLIHSDKGKDIFDLIQENAIVRAVDFKSAIQSNSALTKSVKEHRNRNKFFSKIDKMEFDKLVKKYAKPKFTIKRFLKGLLAKI